MTNAFIRSLGATTAISAVIAFGTTPAAAQEAAPSLELPQAVSAPPVAPADSLPSTSEPAAPSAGMPTLVLPDVSAVAEPALPAQPAPRERAARAAVSAEARAQRPAAAAPSKPVPPQPVAETPAVVAATAPIGPEIAPPADAVLDTAPVTEVSVNESGVDEPGSGLGDDASLAALLAALGLAGGAGLLALRSRRRRAVVDRSLPDEPAYTPRARAEAALPVEPLVTEPAPVRAAAVSPAERQSTVVSYKMLKSPIGESEAQVAEAPVVRDVSDPSPSAAVPAGPIPHGEARDALLQRMVDMPPDAENPFRSRKARRRRARIILQTREQQQREAASEPFDWRTYEPGRRVAPASPQPVTV